MKFIDLHCDTLLHFSEPKPGESLRENTAHVDFLRMQSGGVKAQFFAIFFPPELDTEKQEDFFSRLSSLLQNDISQNRDIIRFARNAQDLFQNDKDDLCSAFLTIEDGAIINNRMSRLDQLYQSGVRLITLTWNFSNCLGSPNSQDAETMNKGLTPFGVEVVERMNELGMIVDVSHLSDGGFWDVKKVSRKPFIASHSNARALSPSQRNLRDDQIRALAESGGCIGITFVPYFLHSDKTNPVSSIERMVAHAAHIKNIGGVECLAIGSDFDGFGGDLEIADVGQLSLLADALENAGFSYDEVERMAHTNIERVIRDCLK